jgi:hypothetical protein
LSWSASLFLLIKLGHFEFGEKDVFEPLFSKFFKYTFPHFPRMLQMFCKCGKKDKEFEEQAVAV